MTLDENSHGEKLTADKSGGALGVVLIVIVVAPQMWWLLRGYESVGELELSVYSAYLACLM